MADIAVVFVQAEAEITADPESAKMAVEKTYMDSLLDKYRDLPAGLPYQRAMAAYQAAARGYNDITRKVDTLWTEKLQIASDYEATKQQLNETQVRLAFVVPVVPRNWHEKLSTIKSTRSAVLQSALANANDPDLLSAVNLIGGVYQQVLQWSVHYIWLEHLASEYVVSALLTDKTT